MPIIRPTDMGIEMNGGMFAGLPLRLLMAHVFLNHILTRRHFVPPKKSQSLKTDLGLFRKPRFAVLWTGTNIPVILYVVMPGWFAWSALPLLLWLRIVGIAVGLAGNIFFVWTHRSLGGSWAPAGVDVNGEGHPLVTHGPYRWIRHPMYTTMLLLGVSFFLISGSWFILLFWVVNFILLAKQSRKEEDALVERYGQDYTTYMQTTPRFIPGVRWA